MNVDDIRREARISDCGRFRYFLRRSWPEISPFGAQRLVVIMLNPSTADHQVDDPTVRKMMSFAMREGFREVTIVNLFAYRSSSPGVLKAHGFPVGVETDAFITAAVRMSDAVLCAWGAHAEGLARVDEVRAILRRYPMLPIFCLGRTKAGEPRHPLYLSNGTPFEVFKP